MSPLFSNSNLKSKDSLKEILENNKNMQRHSPREKLIRIKNFSVQEDAKRNLARVRQKDIFNGVKIEKTQKLIEKFRKFEIRQRKIVRFM